MVKCLNDPQLRCAPQKCMIPKNIYIIYIKTDTNNNIPIYLEYLTVYNNNMYTKSYIYMLSMGRLLKHSTVQKNTLYGWYRQHELWIYVTNYQHKLIKMRAELAILNQCAVPFLSRTAANLCWYYYKIS